MSRHDTQTKGYVTFLTLLIVFGILSVGVISSVVFSTASSQNALDTENHTTARYLALACIDRGLLVIRDTPSYSGSDDLEFERGTCSFSVTGDAIESEATVGQTTVRLVATYTTNPTTITGWQEVAEF